MITENSFDKVQKSNNICDNCAKKEVCVYKVEVEEVIADINKIKVRDRTDSLNIIEAHIKCKYWLNERNARNL